LAKGPDYPSFNRLGFFFVQLNYFIDELKIVWYACLIDTLRTEQRMTNPYLTDLLVVRKELTAKISDLEWERIQCVAKKQRLQRVNAMITGGQLYEPNF